jgi:hypothetical protein
LQEGPGDVGVSREVALFLIEIYFERHYQADLLFRKRDFIQSYKSGLICDHVSRAIFAFASLYVSLTVRLCPDIFAHDDL